MSGVTSAAGGASDNPAGGELADKRELPGRIDIPYINGEMVHLRPAAVADLTAMDQLQAFYNSTGITGKGPQAERAVVNAWVRRSVAWSKGQTPRESGVGDPESRRTVAWAMITEADPDKGGASDASETDGLIGMIFLIDVDGWSRSARIQVVLGKDYRGRGYSRDAMPRVMTYGYAPQPTGLGLHRIWVAVPEKNTRSISVYQSLGFALSGTSRDALWDEEGGKYQDQIVMDALVDEYDPIRSLDAFGMHVIDGNPGVAQARENHAHVVQAEERQAQELGNETNAVDPGAKAGAEYLSSNDVQTGEIKKVEATDQDQRDQEMHDTSAQDSTVLSEPQSFSPRAQTESDDAEPPQEPSADAAGGDATTWAYADAAGKKNSKRAWWRNLGHSRKRNSGGNS
ncbi:N-acetyltransferase [Bombiscardovia nodaiensis]|uniref:N-acetyltransferase n=1 Tax=Bombiscardovia nodaiensis TaxID=2932181 RepID=A0ABM8B9X5_9BIFI|nr:N-acetyltransferase [Bombiscardovia nodaiensis]